MPSRADPRAALVSQLNVGGVVLRSTLAPGVPPAAWDKGVKVVLAASSQCIRLLLASELERDAPPEPRAPAP